MKATSLQTKTIRPGNLNGYSFYYSGRKTSVKAKKSAPKSLNKAVLAFILFIFVASAVIFGRSYLTNANPPTQINKATPAVVAPVNNCAGNSGQLIKVSISRRRLWACDSTKMVYNTSVVTGIAYLAADMTPPGTYHIYAKQTNQTLTGQDSTGSWNDPVSYWMPFLQNQYGTYGFHDATWRPADAFGNIDPNSANASHGCVEMPLAASKWLYNWAQLGTTVTILS